MTEWENLGYHDSDMMGRPGNLDPRNFWQADLDEAARRLVWSSANTSPTSSRPTTPSAGTATRTTSGPTTSPSGRSPGRRPGLVPGAARARAWRDWPAGEGGLAPWSPSKLYEQAIPASVRRLMTERMEALGRRTVGPA